MDDFINQTIHVSSIHVVLILEMKRKYGTNLSLEILWNQINTLQEVAITTSLVTVNAREVIISSMIAIQTSSSQKDG